MARRPPSRSAILWLLNGCRNPSHILQIHAQAVTGSHISDAFLAGRLLLAVCEAFSSSRGGGGGLKAYAELIFSQIHGPSTFAWNTIIRLHAQVASNPTRSISFFLQMRRNAVATDNYTYPFVLKAFVSMPGGSEGGVPVHCETVKRGLDSNSFVRNALITLYCKCGEISSARMLFDGLRSRDLVTWNSMIAGYASHGEVGQARKLFDEMPERDAFSWAILIDGYGKKLGDVHTARRLFDQSPDRDLVCWNSMIDGHAGIGQMDAARELFECMPERNVISWSVMIDGYVRHGSPNEGLSLFQQMLRLGTKPDRVCAVGAITACGELGALDQGIWVHSYLNKNRIVFDVVAETALIVMYMKCGRLEFARKVFERMPRKNSISWNAMIVGLGTNGRGREALEIFYCMEEEGTPMDELTFLAVLTACTHAGLVCEGIKIFHRMVPDFRCLPRVEHYGCVIDLLGRAGRLQEAREIIETLPMKPTPALWGSLLAACRMYHSVELAEVAAENLAELGADDCSVYVLLSNIYAEEGMWEQVWRTRRLMGDRGMEKEIGRSSTDVGGRVHEFVNGDESHPCKHEIYQALRNLSNLLPSSTAWDLPLQ